MAEEEEDDESFGDFKFASFPNQPTESSNHHHWSHFNGGGGASSKPFDPFAVPPSDPAVPAKKPHGAIPLSIFGEEEEEVEEPAPAPATNVFFSNGGGAVKNGSDSNGISNLISGLYNQQRPHVSSENGSASTSNGGVTNSNARDLNPDSEDEDGWEFKSAEWETGNNSQNIQVMYA